MQSKLNVEGNSLETVSNLDQKENINNLNSPNTK